MLTGGKAYRRRAVFDERTLSNQERENHKLSAIPALHWDLVETQIASSYRVLLKLEFLLTHSN